MMDRQASQWFPQETGSNRFLIVSEMYERATVQGEGPAIGTPCTFLRLGGCNLRCGVNGGWKCDSSFTWDWTGINGVKYSPREQTRRGSFDDIIAWLKKFNDETAVRLLVVTGGEPLLQDNALSRLLEELHDTDWWMKGSWCTHVETNGTLIPTFSFPFINLYSVSPKLANSGNTPSDRINIDALEWFARLGPRGVFKFVVTGVGDFYEIDSLVQLSNMSPGRVYIMPEGIDRATIEEGMKAVVDSAIFRGYNLTTRMHIQLFGNKRGV